MELEREQVTKALDTIDPVMDPTMAAKAIDSAEFDIPYVTEQHSHGNGTSEHPESQNQNIEYKIIIEHNRPLMEPNMPLVESNDTHQNGNNPCVALGDIDDKGEDDVVPKHETTRTQSPRLPQLYQKNFENNRYDDTSEQTHIRLDDVTKVRVPRVGELDKFDHGVHSVMMKLSLERV